MSYRLPPLPSLRAFEAAGRHMSFKAAADELCVTPSAVSHAIKGLEEHLGVKLFHRRPRSLLLTDAGRAYLPALRESFRRMEEATRKVSERERADRLTLGCAPSFARVWLMPRLGRFLDLHRDVDLRLLSAVHAVDLVEAEVDLGILFGQRGDWPGFEAERLIEETLVPVCSPRLLMGDDPLRRPEDLARHTLIHTETKPTTWEMWLRSCGLHGIGGARSLSFNRSALALEAAAEGLGVALDSATLMKPYLESGRLVAPFEEVLTGEGAGSYWLVFAADKRELPKIRAFRDWVFTEAGQ